MGKIVSIRSRFCRHFSLHSNCYYDTKYLAIFSLWYNRKLVNCPR